jgi:predicted RNA-binding Zn ribbon-like protein
MVVTLPRRGGIVPGVMAVEQEAPARQAVIAPAPGRLELVRAFVNTLDIEAGTDDLNSPAALATWLREQDLAGPAQSPATQADLRQAIEMREAIREVLLAHVSRQHQPASAPATTTPATSSTGPSGPPASTVAKLRSSAMGLPTRLTITDDGLVQMMPGGHGTAYGLAALMLIAADASASGTWERLKVCSADDCRWAFYDRSPTRSGCWCSMAVCGSRAKSRAFRRRAAGQP